MRLRLLVMFSLVALVGCSDATRPDEPGNEAGTRTEIGEAWRAEKHTSASGVWLAEEARLYWMDAHPVALELGHREVDGGPYLAEGSPEALGLLELVNTAPAEVLDRGAVQSDGPVVGTLLERRPFETVTALAEIPAITRPVLDGMLQVALVDGYVPGFDHRELVISIADLAAANGWDLSDSYGDRLRPVTAGDAERALGALPHELAAEFAASHELIDVPLAITAYAIEEHGVAVGWTLQVVTDSPTIARIGRHYFVSGGVEHDVIVEADYIAQ